MWHRLGVFIAILGFIFLYAAAGTCDATGTVNIVELIAGGGLMAVGGLMVKED